MLNGVRSPHPDRNSQSLFLGIFQLLRNHESNAVILSIGLRINNTIIVNFIPLNCSLLHLSVKADWGKVHWLVF